MRLVKTSPNARRSDEAIARLLIGAATLQLGLFWPNPKGLRQLFGKFCFSCFADTSLYLWHKKSKIFSKILAAHVRDMYHHTPERGITPENLPPAEDVKKVERRIKSEDKKALKASKDN